MRTCPQDTQVSELHEFHQGSREQGSKTSNRNDTFLNPRGKKIVKLHNKDIYYIKKTHRNTKILPSSGCFNVRFKQTMCVQSFRFH